MGDKTIGNDLDNAEISFSKAGAVGADGLQPGDGVGMAWRPVETRSGYQRMPCLISTLEFKMENMPLAQIISDSNMIRSNRSNMSNLPVACSFTARISSYRFTFLDTCCSWTLINVRFDDESYGRKWHLHFLRCRKSCELSLHVFQNNADNSWNKAISVVRRHVKWR